MTDLPLLAFENLDKRFGRVVALDGVSFSVRAGRVTALLGENGAGKSTVMNVLTGLYRPDRGRILMDGAPLTLGRPAAAADAGIGMVHQQFRLIDRLSGFENVSLSLHRGRRWQPQKADAALSDLRAELGFDLDLSRPVWQLSLAERQQLEILRTMAGGAGVLVLDEPTSVLSPPETSGLYAIVRRIAESGRAVVLISHKVREVASVADDIVVMRGGRVTHEGPAAATPVDDLARLIMGRGRREAPPAATPAPGARPAGDVALRLDGLTVPGIHGGRAAGPIDLTLRGGELAVVLGVTGNGQSDLMEAIGGLRTPTGGTIAIPGAAGGGRDFAYVPSQHLGTAIAPGLAAADNAILGLPEARRPLRDPAAIRARTRAAIEVFDVRLDPDAPMSTLSGGNLQRMVLGRELSRNPDLILADYPTRGLDPGTAADIRAALAAAAGRGGAVLMSSEEIEESLAIATRVLVMVGGRIVADRRAAAVDYESVGRWMTGDEAGGDPARMAS